MLSLNMLYEIIVVMSEADKKAGISGTCDIGGIKRINSGNE